MRRILLAILAVSVLAGCSSQAVASRPTPTTTITITTLDRTMITKINNDLSMPLDDTQVIALADKTCRDFSYLYTTSAISDYIESFATMNTHNNQGRAGHAIGVMLGWQCQATAQRIITKLGG